MEAIKKRPALLSFICILGYIWIVFSFPGVFSPSVKKLGDWYPALFGLLVAASFISFIGVWHMKRWGVELYVLTFFTKQIVFYLLDDMSFMGIFFSVVFISCFVPFYRRMDPNL